MEDRKRDYTLDGLRVHDGDVIAFCGTPDVPDLFPVVMTPGKASDMEDFFYRSSGISAVGEGRGAKYADTAIGDIAAMAWLKVACDAGHVRQKDLPFPIELLNHGPITLSDLYAARAAWGVFFMKHPEHTRRMAKENRDNFAQSLRYIASRAAEPVVTRLYGRDAVKEKLHESFFRDAVRFDPSDGLMGNHFAVDLYHSRLESSILDAYGEEIFGALQEMQHDAPFSIHDGEEFSPQTSRAMMQTGIDRRHLQTRVIGHKKYPCIVQGVRKIDVSRHIDPDMQTVLDSRYTPIDLESSFRPLTLGINYRGAYEAGEYRNRIIVNMDSTTRTLQEEVVHAVDDKLKFTERTEVGRAIYEECVISRSIKDHGSPELLIREDRHRGKSSYLNYPPVMHIREAFASLYCAVDAYRKQNNIPALKKLREQYPASFECVLAFDDEVKQRAQTRRQELAEFSKSLRAAVEMPESDLDVSEDNHTRSAFTQMPAQHFTK